MVRQVMTSIKLQTKLHRRLQQRVIEDGYGMRGKSKWIIEAIECFLELPDFPTMVDIANDMDKLTDMVSIRVPEPLMMRIEHSIIKVRKEFPTIEAVQSNLIRASIIQRLLRAPATVTEV